MLAEMTAGQIAEWREFAREEPFGFHPQAELMSLLCAVVANAAPFRGGPGVSPSQFRWRPGREPAATPDGDIRDALGPADADGPDLSRPLPINDEE
jgi:hypothetical protein